MVCVWLLNIYISNGNLSKMSIGHMYYTTMKYWKSLGLRWPRYSAEARTISLNLGDADPIFKSSVLTSSMINFESFLIYLIFVIATSTIYE